MKKTIFISALILLFSFSLSAQQKKDEYKDYKICTECFQVDKWQKTGLENYGIISPSRQKNNRRNGFFAQQGKSFLYGVSTVIVGAITLIIYNSLNNATTR